MKKILALTIPLLLVLTACGSSRRDLNGIPARDPAKAETYTNLDSFPNITRICIDGVAFATMTHATIPAVMRIPEWDGWCKS